MSDDDVFDPLFYTAVFILELPLGASAVFAVHSQTNMNNTLLLLFDLTIIAALTTSGACAIGSVVDYDMVLTLSVWASTLILLLCIWSGLIYRLIITFANTAYEISKTERTIYFICFLVMAIVSLAFFVWIVIEYDDEMDMTILTITLVLFFVVYLISVVFAVHRFCSNLMKLTNAQRRTSVQLSNTMDHMQAPDEAIRMNQSQRRMVQLAVKYVATFSVALMGSISIVAFTLLSDLGMYFVVLDQMINVICLYLQFGFNQKSYRTICCIPNCCCGWLLISVWMGQNRKEVQAYPKKPKKKKKAVEPTSPSATSVEFSPRTSKNATIVFAE